MQRREFTRAVKGEITRRATRDNRIHCEGCGIDLTGKRIEIDHIIAEALVTDKSQKLTAKDGQLLGQCCHRGPDGKTAKDVKAIAKAKRIEAKDNGFQRKSANLIKSQGFAKSAKPERTKKTQLPNRAIYSSE